MVIDLARSWLFSNFVAYVWVDVDVVVLIDESTYCCTV